MSTNIRPEVSSKNEYWISKERYYELKHFCLQYIDWKNELKKYSGYSKSGEVSIVNGNVSDPTPKVAEEREKFYNWMHMLEIASDRTDSVIGDYILAGVTSGRSYDMLCRTVDVPCGKEMYYNLYRKFFWELDKIRG